MYSYNICVYIRMYECVCMCICVRMCVGVMDCVQFLCVCAFLRTCVCVYLSVKDIIPEEFRIPTHSSLPPSPLS